MGVFLSRQDEDTGAAASPELNRVPILSNVSCGLLKYAEDNFEEYVLLPVVLFGQGDFFLLRASGNSMIEADIAPDDLVVVRKQNTAEEGDINAVAAYLGLTVRYENLRKAIRTRSASLRMDRVR